MGRDPMLRVPILMGGAFRIQTPTCHSQWTPNCKPSSSNYTFQIPDPNFFFKKKKKPKEMELLLSPSSLIAGFSSLGC